MSELKSRYTSLSVSQSGFVPMFLD